tara:strand:- start:76231 stop:76467 length:237 start_codon:yes stop_codon:yes gene_type:complete
MEKPFINQDELADRWHLSPRTLERWRWEKTGPTYLKVGGRVLYRLSDIEYFELENTKKIDSEFTPALSKSSYGVYKYT